MSDGERAALIYTPLADAGQAREVAGRLLADGMIACANIFPGIESVFRWQGEIDSAIEVGVVFKTTAAQLEAATNRLAEIHPYDTPAIVGWRCDDAPPVTLRWLADQIGPD